MRELEFNQKNVQELLDIEKDRRGVDRDKLVFLGMADLAQYYWCAPKSLLVSRDMELANFEAYLQDRIAYSIELGYIDDIPESKEKLLDVGNDITLNDIEYLIGKRESEMIKEGKRRRVEILMMKGPDGQLIYLLNPTLSTERKRKYEKLAEEKGFKLVPIDELDSFVSPQIRGQVLEGILAEKYATIRWNFPWEDYVILGIPDGITYRFVYEFKTTSRIFLQRFVLPVALAQANLYGFFFNRPEIRVQIYIMENNSLRTWHGEANKYEAIKLLYEFRNLEQGGEIKLPSPWKCKNCEYREKCPYAAKRF
jgi:CRISPR/Cas system-associated exonuclease Cas4 (RecB family)